MMERSPRAPVSSFSACFGDGLERVFGEDEVHPVVREELVVLLGERVLGLGEDLDQVFLAQLMHVADHRQAADELGDEPELQQILGQHLGEQLAHIALVLALDLGPEAHALLADAPLDDLLQTGEGAAADEEDVGGVDGEELLVRVLAPALGRHAGLWSLPGS